MSFVKIETRDGIATLRVNRPQALNALNAEVLIEIQSQVLKLENTRVLIVTGEGEKAFVAGADIAAMSSMDPMQARAFVELGQSVMRTIEEAPFISIAAVNGFCLGGGLELALSCDIIYASKNSKFGAPETNLGIVPGFGGTANLVSRAGFHKAMDLILTGRIISSDEAKDCGLVAEVFEASELMSKVGEVALQLSKKGIYSLLAARRLVRGYAYESRDRALLLERETFATLFSTGEPREGMKAFLEKRSPQFSKGEA